MNLMYIIWNAGTTFFSHSIHGVLVGIVTNSGIRKTETIQRTQCIGKKEVIN